MRWLFIQSFVILTIETAETAIDENEIALDTRITQGHLASRGQFPWQAIVRYRTSGWYGKNMICGASLISPRHLLTAAHCLHNNQVMQVILGTTQPYDTSDPDRISPDISRVMYNKAYNANDLSNDVGVIELTNPVRFTDTIQPIRLSKSSDFIVENKSVTVSGWGQLSDTQTITASTLNYVNLTTVTNKDCKTVFGTFVKEYTLCTRGTLRQNICSGDSGGPLVQYDNNSIPIQVGIVSFVAGRGCELTLPAGYIRTSHAIPWIRNATGIDFQ